MALGGIGYGVYQYQYEQHQKKLHEQELAAKPPVITKEECIASSCLSVKWLEYPITIIPEEIITVLEDIYTNEQLIVNAYNKYVSEFPLQRPFPMIVREERIFIERLLSLFDKYGLDIPTKSVTGTGIILPKQATGSLDQNLYSKQLCKQWMELEMRRYSLYERDMLPVIQDYPDIKQVLTEIMELSQNRFLGAFTECSH